MMLRETLRLIEAAGGTITLAELSRRLQIDPGALEGMLEHWARQGRVGVSGQDAPCASARPAAGQCGSCSGVAGCPFVARLPRSYAVSPPIRDIENG